MKKTTPAMIATFLTSLVLGGSMLMIGLDATRATTSTSIAANPQALVNIYTNPARAGTITLQTASAAKTTSSSRPVLRTAGS